MASMPGAPLLRRTRASAFLRLPGSTTASIDGPPPDRRAFGVGTRHARFGPSDSGAPGFTLRLRLQGQLQLDVLPLGPHERAVLLTLSVVRAFVGEPTTMPSADFCTAMTALDDGPYGHAQSGASGHDADLQR